MHNSARLPGLILLFSFISLTGYFGYHAIGGPHGLKRRAILEAQITRLERELANLKRVRARLDHHAKLITAQRPGEPASDLLDEQARAMLDVIGPGEIVLMPAQGSTPDFTQEPARN